jgi:hypothetical protein
MKVIQENWRVAARLNFARANDLLDRPARDAQMEALRALVTVGVKTDRGRRL